MAGVACQDKALHCRVGQGRAGQRGGRTEQYWAWSGQTVEQGELCNEFLNLNIKHVDVGVSVAGYIAVAVSVAVTAVACVAVDASDAAFYNFSLNLAIKVFCVFPNAGARTRPSLKKKMCSERAREKKRRI